jgi:hypothetical protein
VCVGLPTWVLIWKSGVLGVFYCISFSFCLPILLFTMKTLEKFFFFNDQTKLPRVLFYFDLTSVFQT